MVTRLLQVERRTGKVCRPKTDVLPYLCAKFGSRTLGGFLLLARFVIAQLLLLGTAGRAQRNVLVKQKTAPVAPGARRPRGRPRKITVDRPKQSNVSQQERRVSGLILIFCY